jgi:AcrR family transcriptional regulator
MGRHQLHSADSILDAARTVLLERGARSTTVAAIASASGAPKGSIYHRFGSQDELLAAMWIRAVERSQAAFIDALDEEDPRAAALAAALSAHDFAVRHPDDARLLASVRRDDLLQRIDAPPLKLRLTELNRPLVAELGKLSRRLFGSPSKANVERTVCAVVDLPLGAMRRHLIARSPIPRTLRGQLEAAVCAALAEPERRTDASER